MRWSVWVAVQAGSPEHKSPAPLVWTLLHCCANCLLRACRMCSILPMEQIGHLARPQFLHARTCAAEDLTAPSRAIGVPSTTCICTTMKIHAAKNP